MAGYAVDEIPTDDEVVEAIGYEPEGRSPTEVLMTLLEADHTRANSQRAIQRVLDRGKVEYNTNLMLVVVMAQKLVA